MHPCRRICRRFSTASPSCYRFYTELADFKEREFKFFKKKKLQSLDAKLSRDELDEIADIVYNSLGQSSNKHVEAYQIDKKIKKSDTSCV